MDIAKLAHHVGPLIKRNSSSILSGIGVAGSVGSLILGIKATPNAVNKLDLAFFEKNDNDEGGFVSLTPFEVVKVVWKDYIPAVGLQIITIASVVGAQSINLRKQAALISVVTISESAFREYQDRMAAEAPTQDRKVRDDIARDTIEKHPASTGDVIIVGDGDQLFYDDYTGRYFQSTKQKVDKAVNDLNYRINGQDYASLNDFYSALGISTISAGDDFGWNAEHKVELDFSTHITDDDRPAIVIKFVNNPRPDFWKAFQ